MSYLSPFLPHLPLSFHPHQPHSWAPPTPSPLAPTPSPLPPQQPPPPPPTTTHQQQQHHQQQQVQQHQQQQQQKQQQQQQQQLQQSLQQQQHQQIFQQQQINDLTRRVTFPLSFPNHIDGPPTTPLFPLSHHYPAFVNHFHHLYTEPTCCGISPFHHFGMSANAAAAAAAAAASPCHQSDLFDYCKERNSHFNLNVNLKSSSNGVVGNTNSVITKNVLTNNNNCDIKVGNSKTLSLLTSSPPILSRTSSSSPIKSNHNRDSSIEPPVKKKVKVEDCQIIDNHCTKDCSIGGLNNNSSNVNNSNNCSNINNNNNNSKIICKAENDRCKKLDAATFIKSQNGETKLSSSSGDVVLDSPKQQKPQKQLPQNHHQQHNQHNQSHQYQQSHQQHHHQQQQKHQPQRQSVIIRKDVKTEEKQSGVIDKKQTMHIELVSSPPQTEADGSSGKSLITSMGKSTMSTKSEPFFPTTSTKSTTSTTPATPTTTTTTASTTCHQSELFAYWKERRKKNNNPTNLNSNLYVNLKTTNGVNSNSVITRNVLLSDKCDAKVGSTMSTTTIPFSTSTSTSESPTSIISSNSTSALTLASTSSSVSTITTLTTTTSTASKHGANSKDNLVEVGTRKKIKIEENSLINSQFNVGCNSIGNNSGNKNTTTAAANCSNENKLKANVKDENCKKLDSPIVITSQSVETKPSSGSGDVNCSHKPQPKQPQQHQQHQQQPQQQAQQSVIIRKGVKSDEKQPGNVDKKQTMHIELVSSPKGETVTLSSKSSSLLSSSKSSKIKKTKDIEPTKTTTATSTSTAQSTVQSKTPVKTVTLEAATTETKPVKASKPTKEITTTPVSSKTAPSTPSTPSSQRVRRRRFRSGLDMIRNAKSRKKAKQSNTSNVNSAAKLQSLNESYFKTNGKSKDGEMIKRNNKISFDDVSLATSLKNNCGGGSLSSPLSYTSVPIEIKRIIVNKALGETILHRAARQGYTHIVRYCLATGTCDINARDNAGYTPLHECCSRGHLEIARALLEHGADIESSATGGVRPFHDAVENDHIEIVRLLLSYGSDPTIATYTGSTPLQLARSSRMIQFLRGFIYDCTGELPPHPDPLKADRPVFPWKFSGSCRFIDPKESGFDVFDEESVPCEEENDDLNDIMLEVSDTPHLPTYRLKSGSAVSIVRPACPSKSTKKSSTASSSTTTTTSSSSSSSTTNNTKSITDQNGKSNTNLYTQNYLKLCDILKQMGLSKDQFFTKFKNIEILCLSTVNLVSNALTSRRTHLPSSSSSAESTSQLSELVCLDDSIREILGIETLRVP